VTIRRAEPTDPEEQFQAALFVHGLGGSSLDWTDLMGLARSDLLCEAIDLPGFGYSPPSPRRREHTIAGHARLVADFIEFNNRGPVHLVGNSMGGAVVTRVAALRPELVNTLTLISPALPDLRLTRTTAMVGAVGVPGLGGRLSRKLLSIPPERRLELLLNMIFANPRAITPEWRDAAVTEFHRRSRLPYSSTVMVRSTRAIIGAYTDFRPDRLWRLAARVKVPTLLVYGEEDKLVHPRTAVRAVRTFPNARLIMLAKGGHVAQLEHPEVVAEAMRDLVRSPSARLLRGGVRPAHPSRSE
jgi:pimeloyl-ACP methyl ester carboxylesterase